MPDEVGNVELAASDLWKPTALDGLEFANTLELVGQGNCQLGQERAVASIKFGVTIENGEYNIFVLGPSGSDRHELALSIVKAQAAQESVPRDWCYVNNFQDTQKPIALSFPAGAGAKFKSEMQALIEELQLSIPAAFEGKGYQSQLKAIHKETNHLLEEGWTEFEKRAAKQQIVILQNPNGYVLLPSKDGEALSEEQFNELPENERNEMQHRIDRLSKYLQERIERVPGIRKAEHEQIRELDRTVMKAAVGVLIDELRKRYRDSEDVGNYLGEVHKDILENGQDFRSEESATLPFMGPASAPSFRRYEVNLLIDHHDQAGAPVIYESNPSYRNLIGKIEQHAEMGALVTHFMIIRSGALHLASGGYLIVDAWRMLQRPLAWEGLKQALMGRTVRIESPEEYYGLFSTSTLQPQPIPIDVKVILIGERWHYYLMAQYDPEFNRLFKVVADLEDDVPRSHENSASGAFLIADIAQQNQLRPFSKNAVQRVLEQSARQCEDNERLSTHRQSLVDLLTQANYWCESRNADLIESEDVERALQASLERTNRVQSRLMRAIERDVLLIDTRGSCVGQVNGLAVAQLGERQFGHPIRIVATSRIGSGQVIDIEKEAKLGGNLHSKGMLTLSAALAGRYARDVPLSLNASLSIEQSYGGIEGDSASVGELCALLSSLADIPIKQNLAITGSVNKLGRVQVIGGVNDKIEGFFEVCRIRGLDGTHGVIIPKDNAKHLMLHRDVVDAVRCGKFHLYAITTIDEAIALLTGVEAGERDKNGNFSSATVNYCVEQQLISYALARQQFGNKDEKRES